MNDELWAKVRARKFERPAPIGWRVVLNTLWASRWWRRSTKEILLEDVEYLRERVIDLETALLSGGVGERGSFFWCPQCRSRVAADEDGCCRVCGADTEMHIRVSSPAPTPEAP